MKRDSGLNVFCHGNADFLGVMLANPYDEHVIGHCREVGKGGDGQGGGYPPYFLRRGAKAPPPPPPSHFFA